MACGIVWWMVLAWLRASTSVQASLLFPAASVLQVTALVSAPVEIPGRKIYWDWGLLMNYDLPYDLEKFTSAPIWPGIWGDRKRRDLNEQQHQDRGNHSWWHIADKYNGDATTPTDKHPSDFTAGELYYALENLLTSYGFHETCLLRSVCELARHPFGDDHQNLITEVLMFMLTPSLHDAFSDSETMYRDVYEAAEREGFLHHNCADLYGECKEDLLTALTSVMMINGVRA